jgi:hypothetical protein
MGEYLSIEYGEPSLLAEKDKLQMTSESRLLTDMSYISPLCCSWVINHLEHFSQAFQVQAQS